MYRYYDSFADDMLRIDDADYPTKYKKRDSDYKNKIDNIEMIVEGEVSGDVSVGLSANYADGTSKTIYNNFIPFPEYEVISLAELEFGDTAIVVIRPDDRETEEPSSLVFRDMSDADIDAIIDTFNLMMNTVLRDGEDDFYFHATIKNGRGVID
jgi:hypothetical protein